MRLSADKETCGKKAKRWECKQLFWLLAIIILHTTQCSPSPLHTVTAGHVHLTLDGSKHSWWHSNLQLGWRWDVVPLPASYSGIHFRRDGRRPKMEHVQTWKTSMTNLHIHVYGRMSYELDIYAYNYKLYTFVIKCMYIQWSDMVYVYMYSEEERT